MAALHICLAEVFGFQHGSQTDLERNSVAGRCGFQCIQRHRDTAIIHADATDHTCTFYHHHKIRLILLINMHDDHGISHQSGIIPVLCSKDAAAFCGRRHHAETGAGRRIDHGGLRIHDFRTVIDCSDVLQIHTGAVGNTLHFLYIGRLKVTDQGQIVFRNLTRLFPGNALCSFIQHRISLH